MFCRKLHKVDITPFIFFPPQLKWDHLKMNVIFIHNWEHMHTFSCGEVSSLQVILPALHCVWPIIYFSVGPSYTRTFYTRFFTRDVFHASISVKNPFFYAEKPRIKRIFLLFLFLRGISAFKKEFCTITVFTRSFIYAIISKLSLPRKWRTHCNVSRIVSSFIRFVVYLYVIQPRYVNKQSRICND